ncbi:hypothetical protein BC830DRAFT_1126812 [Chytriomyces sp. MP71]|nr:hypothetical protein BC830DRAFT_1126812 [Chytriomyces sp. MP71]
MRGKELSEILILDRWDRARMQRESQSLPCPAQNKTVQVTCEKLAKKKEMLIFYLTLVLTTPFLIGSMFFSAFLFAVLTPVVYVGLGYRVAAAFVGFVDRRVLARLSVWRWLRAARRPKPHRTLSGTVLRIDSAPDMSAGASLLTAPRHTAEMRKHSPHFSEEAVRLEMWRTPGAALEEPGEALEEIEQGGQGGANASTMSADLNSTGRSESWIKDYAYSRSVLGSSVDAASSNADKEWTIRHRIQNPLQPESNATEKEQSQAGKNEGRNTARRPQMNIRTHSGGNKRGGMRGPKSAKW